MKHTPGPWCFKAQNHDYYIEANGVTLAEVFSPFGKDSHDARLIAAAPELLEELVIEDHWISNLIGDCVSKTRLDQKAIENNLRDRRKTIQDLIAKANNFPERVDDREPQSADDRWQKQAGNH